MIQKRNYNSEKGVNYTEKEVIIQKRVYHLEEEKCIIHKKC